MNKIRLPYHHTVLEAHLPGSSPAEVIKPHPAPAAPEPEQLVQKALEQGFSRLTLPGVIRSACVAINDKTRPVPYNLLLPPLLEHLEKLGVPRSGVTFLVSTGVHPAMSPAELALMLPAYILQEFTVLCHSIDHLQELEYLGSTSRGTPITINQRFAAADLRIVLGNIEPHMFAGFSGGVKTAAIGLAGWDTIQHNHALMTLPGSEPGIYAGNTLREDIEEIGERTGIHLALNAILNGDKEIVAVLAGDPQEVMADGIPLARSIYEVQVAQPYDLMLVSSGGYPKDINLYQAQKALHHAARITRTGGTLVLVAACPEGTGSPRYEAWVRDKKSHQEVLERFRQEGFQIGPHKAWEIARDASRMRVILVSEMKTDFVRSILLEPQTSLQSALESALADFPTGGRIGVMPYANVTIPALERSSSEAISHS